ncbi:MAG: endolytic transglycosylase MltG [Alphaproteobacteria bacterium]|nr:endolytic transglycosylase MltG [Alphaproteobacteria bacterium]
MSDYRRDTPPTLSVRGGVRPRSPAEALEPGRAPLRPRNRRQRRAPSRRVNRFVRFFSGIMTLSLILLAALVIASGVMFHQFEKPGPLAVTQTVSIPKGEGRIAIARRLEAEGVISSRWAFVAGYLMRSGWRTQKGMDLKAGEYEIKSGASMREVLDTLIAGKSVLYKITIPEGLTSQQIVARLNAAPNLTGEVVDIPAEGTLLPDTYSFSKGADRQELLNRFAAEQTKLLASLWENRLADLPIASVQEAIVLASIVEKETGRADERDRVAGVFVNRLRKKMRLQSDPTIIYGLVQGQGSLGRPLTKKDIASKTAYNTYQINGLPPGPICNPGRAAISATLQPAKTDDIYFVADGTGGHTFSKTLKAHNAAVANWRKVERQRRKQEAQRAKLTTLTDADTAIPNPPASDDAAAVTVAPVQAAAPKVVKVPANATGGEPTPKGSQNEKVAPLKGLRASTVPLPIRRPAL